MMVAEMTLRQTFNDTFILFAVLVQPLLIAVLALYMLKDKGADYGLFVVVGSGLTGLWSSLLFISGNSINVERWSGTLESMVAPIPSELVMPFAGFLIFSGHFDPLTVMVASSLVLLTKVVDRAEPPTEN